MKLLRLLALVAVLPAVALAAAPMSTTQQVDGLGRALGTADNPLVVIGPGGGSGGSSGVTRNSYVCTLPAYASGGNVVCVDKTTGQQSTTAVAANTAGQILPANANRKTFFIQNRTSGVTVDYGYNASVSPGTGIGADGTSATNGQGAGFGENPAHVGAYFATASAAATVVVVQGQ